MGYDPELDTSPELDPEAASYYLALIGVLRCMVELGKVDIITKVSLLSSHIVLHREGHLYSDVQVVTHVGQRYNLRLVCDSTYPERDHNVFKKCY